MGSSLLDAGRAARMIEGAVPPGELVAAMGVFSPHQSLPLQHDRQVTVGQQIINSLV
jgi:hypothetical protein